MPKKTVVNVDAQPKMYATGYIGQTTAELAKGLIHRREMLSWAKSEPRLKCVGEDKYGLVYIDLDDWIEK